MSDAPVVADPLAVDDADAVDVVDELVPTGDVVDDGGGVGSGVEQPAIRASAATPTPRRVAAQRRDPGRCTRRLLRVTLVLPSQYLVSMARVLGPFRWSVHSPDRARNL